VASDSPRIAELRRRVHADPASIAFAQLAEEYRRAGNYDEAVKYCRTGLARHPGYLSARVTLGRALIETGGLDEAGEQFLLVLKSAPDNLAAIRGMAEIYQRRGDLAAALDYYKRALTLARFDPELEETVSRIGREMGAVASRTTLSLEEATSELLSAAERMSPVQTEPTPATTEAKAPGHHLIDFDAVLASLGVPDAAPPPVMEMLLSGATVPTLRPPSAKPPAPIPAATATPAPEHPAALHADARASESTHQALDRVPQAAPEDSAVAEVVEELEAWLRVLEGDRPSDHSLSAPTA
jgi:tetratricopeptide (TPR) repeat protein